MNILCIISLLTIFMKSVIASDSGPDPFHACLKNKDVNSLEDLSEHISKSHPPHKAIQDEAIAHAPDERRNDDEALVSAGKSMLPKEDPGIFKKLMEGTFDSTSKTATNGSLVVSSETASLHPPKLDEALFKSFGDLLEARKHGEVFGIIKQAKDNFDGVMFTLFTAMHINDYSSSFTASPQYKLFRNKFLMHGDVRLVKEITSLRIGELGHLIDTGVMVDVLQQCLKENLHNRFLDLLPIVGKREENSKNAVPRYGSACLSLILTDDGIPLQRLLVSARDLDGNRQTSFNWFCGKLAYSIACVFKKQQVRDFAIVMQALPFKLPQAAFVGGFLNYCEATKFVAIACKEFIAEGFNARRYEKGGKKVWEAIRERFPGEFPEESFTDDDVHAALSRFKTKKQMEDEMRDGMISYLMTALGYTFLPSYPCGIIIDYAPLLRVDYNPKTEKEFEQRLLLILERYIPLPLVLISIIANYSTISTNEFGQYNLS